MSFQQVPASQNDRQLWGRCLRGYDGALGTGSIIDPNCDDIGVSGYLDFCFPVEEWEVRGIWEIYGLNTDSPNSLWHTLSDFKFFKLSMTGYKFRRGFFKSDAWLGPVRMFLSVREH
jgi:hypothetical protein